jgi:hypothetical protein
MEAARNRYQDYGNGSRDDRHDQRSPAMILSYCGTPLDELCHSVWLIFRQHNSSLQLTIPAGDIRRRIWLQTVQKVFQVVIIVIVSHPDEMQSSSLDNIRIVSYTSS